MLSSHEKGFYDNTYLLPLSEVSMNVYWPGKWTLFCEVNINFGWSIILILTGSTVTVVLFLNVQA